MHRCLVPSMLIIAMSLAACSDAESQRYHSMGIKHRVTMYSGGQLIHTWTTTGRPISLQSEDGWQFVDEKTGRLVIVTGDVIIEKLDEPGKGY